MAHNCLLFDVTHADWLMKWMIVIHPKSHVVINLTVQDYLNVLNFQDRWKPEALPPEAGNLVCVVAEQEVLLTRVRCSQEDAAGWWGCLARWFVSSGIHINAKTQTSTAVRCAAVLFGFCHEKKNKTQNSHHYLSIINYYILYNYYYYITI